MFVHETSEAFSLSLSHISLPPTSKAGRQEQAAKHKKKTSFPSRFCAERRSEADDSNSGSGFKEPKKRGKMLVALLVALTMAF